MALVTKDRRPSASGHSRVSRPMTRQPYRRPAVKAAYRRGLLTGFGAGLTAALAIVIAAVLFGPSPEFQAHDHQGQVDPAAANDPADSATPQANVDVKAKHLGNLRVHIEARISSAASDSALLRADAVAFTDMSAMPLAHRQGPITLTEVPGQPGYYEATTKVAMVGDYDIHVEARSPLSGTGHQVITVGTVSQREQ